MMIQIKLTQKGHDKPITAMSSAELYEAGRYAWVLGAQADREAYSLIVYNNTVLQAVEIESLENIVVTDKKGMPQNRRAIHGIVLGAGHPVYEKFVGNVAPKPSTQNPIKYVKDDLDLTGCLCGCGDPVRADFLPGHDQRAIHERIALLGSVAAFLRWFDQTYEPATS